MEKYICAATPKSPFVSMDADTGRIEIGGRSIPDNPLDFYKPLFDWIEIYSLSPKRKTQVNFRFEYFNNISKRELTNLLHKFQLLHESVKSEVEINWFYGKDDPDMLDVGEDFKDMLKVPFNLIGVDKAIL
ncbi:MAG: DUF1987 domain-containing protein [Bacteroidota bacterium]|nr:DUF1987 domain-containing protein [Bacteroidota bacterium]